jgi:hypothetical protein
MKISYAKKEYHCNQCKFPISRGEEMVTTFYKNKTTGVFVSFAYHATTCYPTYLQERYTKDYAHWHATLIKPKPLGRPRLYKDKNRSVEIHRLKALISYHSKSGNVDTVAELQTKLGELVTVRTL